MRGIHKKVSFRSKTENHSVFGGISLRIVYGFGTAGWRGITVLFITLKSWTNLHSPELFFTRKIGVLHENEQSFIRPY